MTALQQLWIASALGALAFFAAGVAVAVVRQRGRSARPSAGELEQLRQRADRADAVNAELRAAMQRARDELAAQRAEVQDVDTAMGQRRARRPELDSGPTAMVPRPESDTAVTAMVPQETARLEERAATAEREAAARGAQLREAAGEIEVLRARISDAEAMRADYVRLRTQANEMEFLAKEIERLKGELTSAKSIAIGGSKKLVRTIKPAPSTGSITDALTSAIERFSDPKMRCIAIADKVGFPVSSYGDDGVELAGYAALLNDVAMRATQFLPVAAPASIEMVDEHGARISVWPFDCADERLLLVNLGVDATDANRVEDMLSEVVGILAPAAQPSGRSA